MKLSKEKRNILKESVYKIIVETSSIHQKAVSMGLQYIGFGRYTDGKVTYKSDGQNLYPMDKSSQQQPKSPNIVAKFIEKVNRKHQEAQQQGIELKPIDILNTMVGALPSKKTGEQYGNKEILQKIIKASYEQLNEFAQSMFQYEKFRKLLLKKYLKKFEMEEPKNQPQQINPQQQSLTPVQQESVKNEFFAINDDREKVNALREDHLTDKDSRIDYIKSKLSELSGKSIEKIYLSIEKMLKEDHLTDKNSRINYIKNKLSELSDKSVEKLYLFVEKLLNKG